MKTVDLILSKHYIYIYCDVDITLVANYGRDKVTYKAGSYEIDCYQLLAEYSPALTVDTNTQGFRLSDGSNAQHPVFNLQLVYDEGTEEKPSSVEWYATNLRLNKMPSSSVSIGGGSSSEVESTLVDITEDAQELLGTNVASKAVIARFKFETQLRWDYFLKQVPPDGFTVNDLRTSTVPAAMMDYLLDHGCVLSFNIVNGVFTIVSFSPFCYIFADDVPSYLECDRLFSGHRFVRSKGVPGLSSGEFYACYANDLNLLFLPRGFTAGVDPVSVDPCSVGNMYFDMFGNIDLR